MDSRLFVDEGALLAPAQDSQRIFTEPATGPQEESPDRRREFMDLSEGRPRPECLLPTFGRSAIPFGPRAGLPQVHGLVPFAPRAKEKGQPKLPFS
jgi:hypothetical protein